MNTTEIRTLLFLNPTIQPGLNLTVRKGDKWADLQVGDVLRVARTGADDETLAFVEVEAALPTRFGDLTQRHLIAEHDPNCREPAGLRGAMEAAYGEISYDDEVILLFFRPALGLDPAFRRIIAERAYQIERGAEKHRGEGGWSLDFDDLNTPNDWAAYIGMMTARATEFDVTPQDFRAAMTKVATLAVSAITASERTGSLPARHYDEERRGGATA